MKSETNFWGSFVFAGRSLHFQSTSRTLSGIHCVWPERDPALGLSYLWFRLMVIGH